MVAAVASHDVENYLSDMFGYPVRLNGVRPQLIYDKEGAMYVAVRELDTFAQTVCQSRGFFEQSLHHLLQEYSAQSELEERHIRDLGSIISGETTIPLLLSDTLYPVAHAYVEETYRRVKEQGNLWPLNDWSLQKIGNENQIEQTNADYASRFVAAYEEYAAQPTAENLALLLRKCPRLCRAYIAVVADYVLSNFSLLTKRRVTDAKPPLWKDAYKALQGHPEAVRLSGIDEKIHTALAKAYVKMQYYAAQSQSLIILKHEKFTRARALYYSRRLQWDFADTYQSAQIGLIKSLAKYDPLSRTLFRTYARWWIRAEVLREYNEGYNPIKVNSHCLGQSLKVSKVRKELSKQLQRLPTNQELEAALKEQGITPHQLGEIQTTERSKFFSLESPLSGGGRRPLLVSDIIRDEGVSSADAMALQQEVAQLREAMEGLTERQRYVITQRWLGEEFIALKDVGVTMGLSRERVRQIEAKAFEILRPFLAESQNI
jgi:RNA polymerase sigma factor (sigma-70 family)